MLFSGLVAVLVVCVYLLCRHSGPSNRVSLQVYCAASMKLPMDEVVSLYEEESGIKVEVSYGGSGQLYGVMKVRGGDLYIPADNSYIEQGQGEGLIDTCYYLSELTAGMMMRKDSTGEVNSLRDLVGDAGKGLRIGIADESAAVGKFTHKVLREEGLLEQLENCDLSKFPTVNEVATQVALGAVDVGIVWDVLMAQYEGLEFMSVKEFEERKKISAVGVVALSINLNEADKLARYLVEKDKGGAVFEKYGFTLVESADHTSRE